MAKGMYVGVSGSRPLLSYNVGDIVKLNIAYGMGLKDHIIVHRGKPNGYYGGDADGIWVMLKAGFIASKWSSDGLNNYSSINLGIQDASIFYSAEVQNIIKTVKIPYYYDYTSGLSYGENGAEVKFFIPSADEMGYNNVSMHQYADRGLFLPPLDYFKNNSTSKPNGITTWTRSPNLDNNTTAFFISSSGTIESASCSDANYANYIFVLPYNAEVKDGTITGQLYDAATANGVSKKVTKIYCGVKKTEADYTSVQELSDLAVGTTIKIKENGVDSDYIVVNQGPPENTLYPDSPSPFYENADGTWLMRKNALNGAKYFYQDSSIYPTFFGKYFLNDNFFYCLPKKLQKIIKKVKIPYVSSLEPTVITLGTNGDENKIFIPGFTELGIFAPTNMVQTDSCGTLEYFKDLEITDEKYAIKDDTGADAPFFVRSPTTMTTVIGKIENSFTASNGVLSVHKGGFGNIVPMMILPYETAVLDGEVTGHLYGDYPSVARKVLKGYIKVIGEGNKNWWELEKKIVKYGTNTLSQARHNLAATSIGDYALFAGGANTSSLNVIDIFNSSLTKTTDTLNQARTTLAATSVGDYALFGGGRDSNGVSLTIVDIFNYSLTKRTDNLSQGRSNLVATSIGNYALFGGGYDTQYTNVVDVFSSSLVKSTKTLSEGLYNLAATSIEKYALFGGGLGRYGYSNTVDIFNSSLTRTSSTLSQQRTAIAATSVGDYALFGGGANTSSLNVIDIFNSSLTKSTNTLSKARYNLAASSLGKYALFGGGYDGDTGYLDTVDIFDSSLTRTSSTLNQKRAQLAATSIGEYVLFGGGTLGSYSNTVDIFKETYV